MDEQSETYREAVEIFTSANDLQAAIDKLLSSSFHRTELSLLAGEHTANKKLNSSYANAGAIADDSVVPRTAYVSSEVIWDAQGAIVGGLGYAGSTIAAGAIVVSGGTIFAAIVAATLVGGAGGIVGSVLVRWLDDNHAHYLQAQIDHGGLLLWVRTRNAGAEDRAVGIWMRRSSRDVQVHALSPKAAQVLSEMTNVSNTNQLAPF